MPVRPELLDALGMQETGGESDPDAAISVKGARGRYQITKPTARAYGFDYDKLGDKEYSRKAATTILAKLIDQHKGDEREALKSYYGRGKPPKGHPTADEYADKVLKMAAPATLSDKDFAEAPEASKTLTDADMAGSVYEKTGPKLKRIGKTAAELGVGVALPAAAAYATGGASVPVQIAGQAIAGAGQPYAEAGVEKAFGGSPQMPGWKDAARNAAFMAGVSMLGAGIGAKAGTAAPVASEIRALPKEAQTAANVKQALRNREVWKAHGLNDQQIDAALKSPEIQADLARQIAAGNQYRGAFQTVIDETRKSFAERYDPLIPKDVRVDAVPIGQAFEGAAQAGGEHEITPSFRSFLQRKGLELTKAGESTGPSVGGVPWKALPEKLKEQIRTQGGKQGITTPSSEFSIQDLRDLRTELRENISGSATNLDRKVAQQLNDQITKAIEEHLTPEQRGALNALDAEYGRFQDVIKKLDPRSEKYGSDVANALFDPMVKNSGDALNFIRLAKAAEAARPGEVMPQLREAFLQKAIEKARIGAQGRPVEEMKAIRALQEQWGGDKNLNAVLTQMFPNSPLRDATTLSRVLGTLSKPDEAAAEVAKGVNPFGVPTWMLRIGGAYAMYHVITGSPVNPWRDMTQDAPRFIAGMATLYFGSRFAGRIYSSTDTALKQAYTKMLLDPNVNTFKNVAQMVGSGTGAIAALPSDQPTSE